MQSSFQMNTSKELPLPGYFADQNVFQNVASLKKSGNIKDSLKAYKVDCYTCSIAESFLIINFCALDLICIIALLIYIWKFNHWYFISNFRFSFA